MLSFFLASVFGTPVVLWHGMGDNCCHSFSMGAVSKMIREKVETVNYVKSLMIGDSETSDTSNGFLMPVFQQVELACQQIRSDPELQEGYHAIGFSQGGQFLRALAQRCPSPPMKNLISIGGQHQGIFGFPKCPDGSSICEYVRKMLNWGAYSSFIQSRLVQAQYWHDPLQEETYKQYSQFIAVVNNEHEFNQTYKDNLEKLENLVLVKFAEDTMVVPKESSHFGYYSPGQDTDILAYNQTDLYKENRIGLKTLNTAGKLHFFTFAGDHLRFTDEEFTENLTQFLA